MHEVVDRLNDLLEQERRALTEGDFDRIDALIPQKQELIEAVERLDDPADAALAGLQDNLRRNHVLLASALEGIRAVADRLAELRRVRQGLDTYSRSGRKTRLLTGDKVTMERRA